MATLSEILGKADVKLAEVTAHLDGLGEQDRIDQVVALNKAQQMKLWDIAEGSEPLSLAYLVPADARPLEPYPFEGKNSLPMFTRFQKVFYKDNEGTSADTTSNP
jgi:hypothetical protein